MHGDSDPILEKHKRYGSLYKKNDLFWGLGIECESYFEMSKRITVTKEFILNKHKSERYSVDYYTSYEPSLFDAAMKTLTSKATNHSLPLLLNAHVLTKTDKFLEHKTLYKKNTPPNPNFVGYTLFERLQKKNPSFFLDTHEIKFTFDGDSIEIMTQDFYKATVSSVVREFTESRKSFIDAMQSIFRENQILTDYGIVQWAKENYGFAIMATNRDNLAIFNNGTYHINLTLPTQLNEEGKIKDYLLFERQHRALIRLIQWIEPVLIGTFGSPDVLHKMSSMYSAGSQRGAMSRYIGLGSYDTNKMVRGKILSTDTKSVRSTWYTQYHEESGYKSLNTIGLDINYNKHWNHGVEIRFFDWFPEGRLPGLLRFLSYVSDIAVDEGDILDPLENKVWNAWMTRTMQRGAEAGCSKEEALLMTKVFSVECKPEKNLNVFFADFYCALAKKWKGKGPCSKYFLGDEVPLLPVIKEVPVMKKPVSFFSDFMGWLFKK
jgi:hypothetical protein